VSKPDRPDSELVDAAAALDGELRRFEELSLQIKKLPLNTEKNLERAAKSLEEIADSDERLGLQVKALVAAVAHVRERQQSHATIVQERALELQARTEVYQELLKHFGTLGQEAGSINAMVQDIAAQPRTSADERAAVMERLVTAQEKMALVADGAKALTDAANAKDFQDLARSADNLRQSLLAARNKIGLLHKGLQS
jgi:hypothetical protein